MTADIHVDSVSIFAHLLQDSEKGSSPSSYDVSLQIESLKGRINLAVLTRERLVIAKLDGWPEVGYTLFFERIYGGLILMLQQVRKLACLSFEI